MLVLGNDDVMLMWRRMPGSYSSWWGHIAEVNEVLELFSLGSAVDGRIVFGDEKSFFEPQFYRVVLSADDDRCKITMALSSMLEDRADRTREVLFHSSMKWSYRTPYVGLLTIVAC